MSPAGLHADAAEIISKRPGGYRRALVFCLKLISLDAATVVAAPSMDIPLNVLLVVSQSAIFRQAHFFRCRVEALAPASDAFFISSI